MDTNKEAIAGMALTMYLKGLAKNYDLNDLDVCHILSRHTGMLIGLMADDYEEAYRLLLVMATVIRAQYQVTIDVKGTVQ